MSFYNVNFEKLFSRLIPSFLYSEPLVSWMTALSKPIKTIHSNFKSYVNATNLTLSYSSRKRIFEEYLNDLFDPSFRRIYITNNLTLRRVFIYFLNEGNENPFVYDLSETPITQTYIGTLSEQFANYDFSVYVPNSVSFDQNQMKAIINSTKLAGKRYNIVIFKEILPS